MSLETFITLSGGGQSCQDAKKMLLWISASQNAQHMRQNGIVTRHDHSVSRPGHLEDGCRRGAKGIQNQTTLVPISPDISSGSIPGGMTGRYRSSGVLPRKESPVIKARFLEVIILSRQAGSPCWHPHFMPNPAFLHDLLRIKNTPKGVFNSFFSTDRGFLHSVSCWR